MLSLLGTARVFLVAGVTDMRKSFNGLSAIVETTLEKDPLSGQLYVFCNRRRNRLKLLFWDGSGYWVCAKRLESGTFSWPTSKAKSIELTSEELAFLVGGIDLIETRMRRWYRRSKTIQTVT